MKIKQQKQIKTFLIEEFRKDRGSALFDEQEKALNTIIKTQKQIKNQMKTLISTILPALHSTRFCQKRFYGRCRIQAYAKIYA